MGLVTATTVGLLLWIVLWALGYKAIDGFMITLVIVLVAVTVRMLTPYLPGNRE
jgi:Mn2+/Fe2+ NRAMP family transporter